MSQTPLAHTGDSVGRFRRYQCSTPFNYHSNLSMCGTFLQKAIHIQDNCGLLATPKEIYDLNLSTVTLSIWLSQTPASNFCAKELYNPIFFSSASIPSRQSFRMIVSGLRNLKFGCYATHSQQNRHEPWRTWPHMGVDEGTGTPCCRLREKLQQSCPKVPHAERNRYDSKDVLWAFVFGFRTGANWCPGSTVPILQPPHRSLSGYFSISVQIFSHVAPLFPGQHVS